MTTYYTVGIVCSSIIKRMSVCPVKFNQQQQWRLLGFCFWARQQISSDSCCCPAMCWLCEFYLTVWRSNIHKHPFNGPFSGTTRVNRYQKGKTNLDFTKPRDSEWQWHQLGHMQVCTSLQTDNHATLFLQAGCPSCRPTNSIKELKFKALIED